MRTMGEEASASGSAQTEKRGATGKPFLTWAFIASGETIQAMALMICRWRAGLTCAGMVIRKPPIGAAILRIRRDGGGR